MENLALPAAALLFFVLALVVPAIRTWRRTGVWPIVVGKSASPHQRWFAWLIRAFALGCAGWLVAYAVLGPAAVGVVAAPRLVGVAGWALMAPALLLVGAVLVAPAVVTAAAAVAVIVALALQTRLEERHLIGLHGGAYLGWAARVGRFFPGIGRLHRDD